MTLYVCAPIHRLKVVTVTLITIVTLKCTHFNWSQ
jgi:hypothetical protein